MFANAQTNQQAKRSLARGLPLERVHRRGHDMTQEHDDAFLSHAAP